MGVPTTIILDEDVVARLQRQSESSGTSVATIVNDLVRQALPDAGSTSAYGPFPVLPRSLGEPLVDFTCLSALDELDDMERYRDLFRR